MALNEQTEMSASETDALLARNETGVLSLAREEEPYAIPISYGYDPDQRTFYMRLVSTPGSEKRAFLTSSPSARLVVYEEEENTYRSAVARGTIERIDPEKLDPAEIAQYGQARRPLFEVWGESKADLDIQLYRFSPDDISGRHIEIDEDGDGAEDA